MAMLMLVLAYDKHTSRRSSSNVLFTIREASKPLEAIYSCNNEQKCATYEFPSSNLIERDTEVVLLANS